MKYPSYVMRMLNEATELNARINDLTAYISERGKKVTQVEAVLLDAQCRAMSLYAKMLGARLQLATGVKS